jgi:flagellar basal-body rod protein FlgF
VNISVYQAAGALDGYARWQEVISENLASASVPGFKRQDLSFSAVEAGLMPVTGPNQHFSIPQANTLSSFRQGEMRYTGVTTDVAIEGAGFFEVQLPNGATAYTRDGEFKLNSQGQLVTKQGYLVLGDAGEIQVDRNAALPLSISSIGHVSSGADVRGRLKVVDFDQPQLLTPIGGGYFLADNPQMTETDIAQPSLRQGFLESANTSTISEMASLVSVMRAFEANQRVIQMHDERMGRAITELGNPA